MSFSEVYFVDARAKNSKESLLNKIALLFDRLDIASVVKGRRVAIKTHVGAPLCVRYLRPVYVRRIVDLVRDAGGEPFVTDITTLDIYGRRVAANIECSIHHSRWTIR